MTGFGKAQDGSGKPWLAFWLGLGLAWCVVAGAVFGSMAWLRHRVREQLLHREAEVFNAAAQTLLAEESADGAAPDILTLSLQVSRLPQKGVFGLRTFDAAGKLVDSFPAYLSTNSVALFSGPVPAGGEARFLPRASLESILEDMGGWGSLPDALLAIRIPILVQGEPKGAVEFLIEGNTVAREYANLDRTLWRQGLVLFGSAAALLAFAFVVGFRQVERANRQLREQSRNLQRANEELTMLYKTSALGAVTAHLVHGLKNPLAGLQEYLRSIPATPAEPLTGAHQDAIGAARRMDALIRGVVGILREDASGVGYTFSLEELGQVLKQRLWNASAEKQIELVFDVEGAATLDNRQANLATLVVENLGHNAIEASAPGAKLRVRLEHKNGSVFITVTDAASGIPEELRAKLFTAVPSTKPGGSGLGLAISAQMARHLGGSLELTQTGREGSTFVLRIPVQD